MRTITVVARKGGTGKTTVAVHLALAAHLRGAKTLIADTDPQRSASAVLKLRQAPGPGLVATSGPKLFAVQVAALRAGVELLVIDTPAAAEKDMAHALVLADWAIVVLRPTYLDLAAAAATLDVVRRLGKPVLIVINQAPYARDGREAPAVRRVRAALDLMRPAFAPTVLHARLAYQTAFENGLSAEESGDAVAAREVSDLWAYIARLPAARQPNAAG